MSLVQLRRSLVSAVVAIPERPRAVAEENVVSAAALVEIDGVRPGIGNESFKPMGKPLFQLHHQRIVIAVAARFYQVDAPPSRIDAVRQAVAGDQIFADLAVLRIV